MREIMIDIGAKIRQRRELLGLVQPQLGALSGVNIRTIQLIEQGKGNPSLETLLRLIDTLGLNLELGLKIPSQKSNV